jgi:hypothetical protein
MSEMKFLELHGDRVAYQDVGSGPEALLLIHGMAGSSETWRAVIPSFRGITASSRPTCWDTVNPPSPGDYSSAHSRCGCGTCSTSWGSPVQRSSVNRWAAAWPCSSSTNIRTTANGWS